MRRFSFKVAAEIAAAEKATAKKAAAEKAIAEREGEDVERNDDPMDEDPHVADDEESDDVEDPYDRRHDARVDSSANIERTLNFCSLLAPQAVFFLKYYSLISASTRQRK